MKSFDSRLCGLSVSWIAWYRRSVSPRKGFACAYRTKTGGASCSQFASQAFQGGGWWPAIRAVVDRLRLCGQAARSLRRERAINLANRLRDVPFDGEPVGEEGQVPKDANAGASECVEGIAECCFSGCAVAFWRVG